VPPRSAQKCFSLKLLLAALDFSCRPAGSGSSPSSTIVSGGWTASADYSRRDFLRAMGESVLGEGPSPDGLPLPTLWALPWTESPLGECASESSRDLREDLLSSLGVGSADWLLSRPSPRDFLATGESIVGRAPCLDGPALWRLPWPEAPLGESASESSRDLFKDLLG
jgi:hypothetical protein